MTELDVNGIIRMGRFTTNNRPNCTKIMVGSLIFDTDIGKPFVCDGSKWKPLDSDFDNDGIVDWNDEDDNNSSVKHPNLVPENIKSGINIFGINGTYSNDFLLNQQYLIDMSGFKVKEYCHKNLDINQNQILKVEHDEEDYHYFLALIKMRHNFVGLISIFDKINNTFQYFESPVIAGLGASPLIKISEGCIFFIARSINGTHTSYNWTEFKDTTFTYDSYSHLNIVQWTSPWNSNANNQPLYTNQKRMIHIIESYLFHSKID